MQVQHTVELKAYEDKVASQLAAVKAKLSELEAHFKGKKADTEIETIRGLKTAHHDIEKKVNELKMVGEAKVGHLKTEIDGGLANVNTKLTQLSNKLHAMSKS